MDKHPVDHHDHPDHLPEPAVYQPVGDAPNVVELTLAEPDHLLLEDGGRLMLEGGGFLLLESSPPEGSRVIEPRHRSAYRHPARGFGEGGSP